MKGRFDSKVALVTGGTSGIGAATAKRFAREGAVVACIGRDGSRAKQIVSEIEAFGAESVFIQADATNPDHVAKAVDQAINHFGRIDILFNGAGVQLVRQCTEMTAEEWGSVIDSNLKSAFLFSKFAIPSLKQSRGVIINMGSELGIIGAPKYTAYCAAKGGVVMFTRALALECSPFGVRVNCICPGATATPMLEREIEYYTTAEAETYPNRDTALKFLADMIPLHRVATVDEVANVIAFVASGEASYMTGAVISVDAGTTAK